VKTQAQFQVFQTALQRLMEALELQPNAIHRDSAILRFELVFETAWRLCQTLAHEQGFAANSPKAAFQAAFKAGWITEEVLWNDILLWRNQAVHVYQEALAERLYEQLPQFVAAFRQLEQSVQGLV
jgi:nucleotidyltransferase substrate binding protein (TIGR01987 family)